MRKLHVTLCVALAVAFLTATLQAEDKVVEPFNGKNLDGWKLKGNNKDRSHWTAGSAKMNADKRNELVVGKGNGENHLINAKGRGVDIYTEQKFGDCTLSIELMVPKGSNSGIYFMGNYEIQVLDSFGKAKAGPGDLGGIYGSAAPRSNAAKAPGEWQKFEIEFQAPKFEDGKKVANAKFVKVTLNGKVIHENVEVAKVTGGNLGTGEKATGPLMFQGDHGPVAYRNIRIKTK